MAIPLTTYLTSAGSYDGIDVALEPLRWAAAAITPRFPNFRFSHADLATEVYNVDGVGDASSFIFPYADKAFDFIFLTSVFTHLLPAECSNYISEAARMLRTGGTLFATWFIVSPEAPPLPPSSPDFASKLDGYFVEHLAMPRAAVAYTEADALAMYRAAGFAIEFHRGEWGGRPGLTYQDIIIGRKPN
jgi:SAM-dependent methyltransferase